MNRVQQMEQKINLILMDNSSNMKRESDFASYLSYFRFISRVNFDLPTFLAYGDMNGEPVVLDITKKPVIMQEVDISSRADYKKICRAGLEELFKRRCKINDNNEYNDFVGNFFDISFIYFCSSFKNFDISFLKMKREGNKTSEYYIRSFDQIYLLSVCNNPNIVDIPHEFHRLNSLDECQKYISGNSMKENVFFNFNLVHEQKKVLVSLKIQCVKRNWPFPNSAAVPPNKDDSFLFTYYLRPIDKLEICGSPDEYRDFNMKGSIPPGLYEITITSEDDNPFGILNTKDNVLYVSAWNYTFYNRQQPNESYHRYLSKCPLIYARILKESTSKMNLEYNSNCYIGKSYEIISERESFCKTSKSFLKVPEVMLNDTLIPLFSFALERNAVNYLRDLSIETLKIAQHTVNNYRYRSDCMQRYKSRLNCDSVDNYEKWDFNLLIRGEDTDAEIIKDPPASLKKVMKNYGIYADEQSSTETTRESSKDQTSAEGYQTEKSAQITTPVKAVSSTKSTEGKSQHWVPVKKVPPPTPSPLPSSNDIYQILESLSIMIRSDEQERVAKEYDNILFNSPEKQEFTRQYIINVLKRFRITPDDVLSKKIGL